MEFSLWHLDPLRASAFVPLPKRIRDKRDVTNIIGTGDDCFKWTVLAGLHPAVDNPSRMENYLERHMERCIHVQLSKFPKDTSCKFTNIQKQLQTPFVVYADFESILKPLSNIDTTQGVEERGLTFDCSLPRTYRVWLFIQNGQ